MPTTVLRDYITNAEVAELLRNPGVSQKIKDALQSPAALLELAKPERPAPPLITNAGQLQTPGVIPAILRHRAG
jgi:hypothetical protein